MRNICKNANELFRLIFDTVMKSDENCRHEESFYIDVAIDWSHNPKLIDEFHKVKKKADKIEDPKKRIEFWKSNMKFDPNTATGEDLERCIRALYPRLFDEYEFPWQNVNVWHDDFYDEKDRTDVFDEGDRNGLIGLHTLPTGEVFFAFFQCGDEEFVMVNSIIYAEDGKLKWYAPEKGNSFNVKEMCAFGWNDEHGQKEEYDVGKLENYPCDADEELADIEDYFQNRQEGQHADGIEDENSWWEIEKKYLIHKKKKRGDDDDDYDDDDMDGIDDEDYDDEDDDIDEDDIGDDDDFGDDYDDEDDDFDDDDDDDY